ncbi:hypothetical protein I7I50_11558 [Histoplasma capsulatum G186AR]|uniref:Uncharacterized protein n=1 Tax=Ajellomyces capsulatus TaxID=5037 RepID=A0A8H8D9C9_AJECA|nr:hypothetical protein I7I52_02795 [Histoplasma capsulatum]QSS70056.1 hypothetical protein I7I50_11558 [Histoplasma capsulatum G186AR]
MGSTKCVLLTMRCTNCHALISPQPICISSRSYESRRRGLPPEVEANVVLTFPVVCRAEDPLFHGLYTSRRAITLQG